MKRFASKRFQFDVENYIGDDQNRTYMKHIKIYCEGAMQTDLWFDPKDISALTDVLDYDQLSESPGRENRRRRN